MRGPVQWPALTSAAESMRSFRADNGPDENRPDAVQAAGKAVRLPVIGWVTIREEIRFVGHILSNVRDCRRRTLRILAFDRAVAEQWGALLARCSLNGTPMPAIDSMLAATALAHDLTVVTGNTDDFGHAGVPLVNPFS